MDLHSDSLHHLHDHHHPHYHRVKVNINRKECSFDEARQTGQSIKHHAGIPHTDVLFLHRPHEDEVIPNDAVIVLKDGEEFHSAPPANYGAPDTVELDVGLPSWQTHHQPGGWTFLVIEGYPLPTGFSARSVRLLVKLPPTFPDAAPDMFWVSPVITTATGGAPMGTSSEAALGQTWQRFSWHLQNGGWRPGISTLRDFMRCVRARLELRT